MAIFVPLLAQLPIVKRLTAGVVKRERLSACPPHRQRPSDNRLSWLRHGLEHAPLEVQRVDSPITHHTKVRRSSPPNLNMHARRRQPQ